MQSDANPESEPRADQVGAARKPRISDLVLLVSLFAALTAWSLVSAALRDSPAPGSSPDTAFGGVRPAILDINRAPADELAALPGVGRVLARRIAAGRAQFPYRRIEDLSRVPGIGPVVTARIAPYVVFVCEEASQRNADGKAGPVK